VAEIDATARRIRTTALDERIRVERLPRELAQLAETFNEMLDRISESFGRLSRFSADLAHELRTPIHNLRGETEVALAKTRTVEEYREVLESSLEEYDRLSRMIESLLFLARAESSAAPFERQTVEARREVEAVREVFDPVAEERGVALACEGEASLSVSAVLFRRLLSNLVANALEHTPAGGRVGIEIAQDPDGAATIRVADTGRGIEPEHLPRVFDRFYRADPSRSAAGSGLGLAIAKSIVELHGGSIALDSSPGRGTRVTLRFPAAA
jgi:two-component system heavy metal sensor histidine kinase CusS